jgi:hypothetical protein
VSNSQIFYLTRKILVLSVMSVALWFVAIDRPAVVKADNCWDAWGVFSDGFHTCAISSQCNPSSPSYNPSQCVSCFMGLGEEHAIWGGACALASHSPMIDSNASCNANGDRIYDNCMAGTAGALWGGKYNQCLAAAGDAANMVDCCEALRTEYLAQGCY